MKMQKKSLQTTSKKSDKKAVMAQKKIKAASASGSKTANLKPIYFPPDPC